MQPLLKVEDLAKTYARRSLARDRNEVRALDGVSFSIFPGTTLAIVGESGSGKSTLALCLACLESPTAGSIWFEEADIVKFGEKERRAVRRKIQLIFQDPAISLNPRWRVGEILAEPMSLASNLSGEEITRRAHAFLELVGLSSALDERFPAELSGGQRQRLAIARALAVEPKLLVLDEALSALDCSVQAQVANLLLDLQVSLKTTLVFISHDLAMAAHLADEVAVMNRGRVVESGPPETILKQPKNDVTRALLAAVPRMSFSQVQRPEL